MSFTHSERASVRPPAIFWPLLGLGMVLAADGATAFVLFIMGQWANNSLSILYLAAPIAALLVGIPAWFFFIVTPGCVTLERGMQVGVIGSLAAHPVMWITVYLSELFMSQSLASLPLPYLLLFSLALGGWVTTPIGALAGVLLIALQRALMRAQQQRVSRRSGGNPVARDE